MNWSTPETLRAQVQKLWDRGTLLACLVTGSEEMFPLRLTLKKPKSGELSTRYADVQDWIEALSGEAVFYQIEWHRVNHRVLGANQIPAAVWIDNLDNALKCIGKTRAARRFSELVTLTRQRQAALLPWLARRPLRALALADDWPRLLNVIDWMCRHPRPDIYLRQIALPGIHSKFIESHRGVLSEWLDILLPEEYIHTAATGISGFYQRYGFREKPLRVRFRLLDPSIKLLPNNTDQDITVTREAFAGLDIPVSTIFITENEVNFLAFPGVSDALVIFGAGYGFENLAAAEWLNARKIYYWGDIDTHGFAILHQLRHFFPKTKSMLMDEQTLLAHRTLWGTEAKPETGRLDRLTQDENALYERLCSTHWGKNIRLEQERIGYAFLLKALAIDEINCI